MTPIKIISPHLEGRLKSDFTTWQHGDEGFKFDDAICEKQLGDFTSLCKLDNGLLAKTLLVDGPFNANGWKNMLNWNNVALIENAFHNLYELYNIHQSGEWRINIPKPHGLYLIKRKPMNSLYPAFVMDNIPNDFSQMSFDKKKQILEIRNHMTEVIKSYGFYPWENSPEKRASFVYSKDCDKVFLVGLSTWERR